MFKKKIGRTFLIVLSFLLIPLIAMQFTDEVNWSLMDFIVGGVLLFGTGLLLEGVFTYVKNGNYKIILSITILLIFLLIWAQLAVGIF